MLPYLNPTRLRFVVFVSILLHFLPVFDLTAQVAAFVSPDTVCVSSQITITNQSTLGQNYYWSFCSGNTLSNPVGVNIGNPGNRLDVPVYITLVKDGNVCYSFITNHGTNVGVPGVTRYNHGTSFSNNPVSSTSITGFGMTDSILGIKICKENGQWLGFVCNSSNIIRMNFGSSLSNSPTGTMLGPYSMLDGAHCIDIFKENGNWVGYLTCATSNNLVRLNFTNGLLNPPVLNDLGTIGGTINMPYSFRVINENGIWYALVANSGNNTLTRLTFGISLFNTPTGVNLGPAIQTTTPGGITLIRDCESTTGFQLNYSSSSPNLIWRLSFPSGITGSVAGTSLGNIGNMERPAHFSELFRVGDTLFLYATNRDGNSLTRLRFLPCANASVPSSALYDPPPFSYNQPGTYNVQLIVNEGLPNQASLCKNIIVMPQQLINLGGDLEICQGTTTTLDAGAGFSSYLWSTGATTRMIAVGDSGVYWAKGTRYGCEAKDTIKVALFPVIQVYLGRDTTICEGQSVTFDAGSCRGCSYLWSNLTTGQTNIGTGQTYTTGITGEYSVNVTSPDGCPVRDSVQLIATTALIQGYVDTTLCFGTPFYAGGALQTNPGIYLDTIPVAGKCDSIVQTTLRYKPEIPVSLGNDTTVCAGSPIKLRTGVPSAGYQWQDSSTDSTFTVFVPGSYWVMVTKDGCNATDSIQIAECISPLWFPNAFTPNGDGANDTFCPHGWGVVYYEILIFDRWGKKVFESNTIEPGWDGRIKGERCSDGVYVFVATYSMADSSGETYHTKGSITLLR